MRIFCSLAVALVLVLGGWAQRAVAQQEAGGDPDVVQLRPNFYLIAGAGGNIVMQLGPEGVILVDSGSTAMSDAVLATIRRVTPLPIRYIINTSMDADHVGGNDKFAKAGLTILAGAIAAGAGLSDDLVTNAGGAVPAAPAGGRRAGLGACRPGDGGVGVGGVLGAEGVCVDYAPFFRWDGRAMTGPLPGMVEHWANVKPDDVAIIESGRTFTWRDWNDQADRLAYALRGLGLVPGDIVVTRVQIRAEWPIISAALGKIGCRVLGLNWRLTPAETKYVLENSGAHAIILDDPEPGALLPALEGLPLKFAVSVDAPAEGCLAYADLVTQPAREPLFATGARRQLHLQHDAQM